MGFSISRQPLSSQIAIAMAALSFICFGALSFWLSHKLSSAADAAAESVLSGQLDMAALAMDDARLSAERQAQSMGKQFERLLASRGPLSLNDKEMVPTGPVMLPKMMAGKDALNADSSLLEDFKKTTGVEAAILMVHQGKVYRLSTLLKDKDGKFMVGTLIPPSDLAAKTVASGKAGTNVLTRNGKVYASRISPLLDASGETLGFMSIRIDLTPDIDALKALLSSRKVGKTGHLFAFDPEADNKAGLFIFHPSLEGKPLAELQKSSPAGFDSLSKAVAAHGGTFQYAEPDGQGSSRAKFLISKNIPSWGWQLAGGTYLDEFHDEANSLSLTLFGAAALCAVLLAVISALILSSRLAMLSDLRAQLGRQAQGDFTGTRLGAPQGSRNELHMLAHSIDSSTEKIQALASTSRDGVLSIDSAARSAKSAADGLALQVGELNASARSMSVAIDALAVASDNLRSSSSSTSEASRQASALAAQGQASMLQAQASQRDIHEGISQATDSIKALGARGSAIRAMASAIGDIASQTNLLALNAAIEAARAGESGRGFAVVADEVRKLAERSAQSATEIQATIKNIARETEEASARMNKVSQSSELALDASVHAGDAFGKLAAQSALSGGLVAKIDLAIQEQAQSLKQLSSLVRDVESSAESVEHTARDNNESSTRMGLSVKSIQDELGTFKI
jgi:methyl-accepting chemotaxis protein